MSGVASKTTAWSADGERILRARIMWLWYLRLFCFGVGIISGATAVAAVHWLALLTVAAIAAGVYCFWISSGYQEQLGWEAAQTRAGFVPGRGMLANKPRSLANLTRWFYHPGAFDPGERLVCECGLPYFWSDARLIDPMKNSESPRQGELERDDEESPAIAVAERYVILCRCGAGHYKLRDQ